MQISQSNQMIAIKLAAVSTPKLNNEAVVHMEEEKKPAEAQQKHRLEVSRKWKRAKILPCVNPNCPQLPELLSIVTFKNHFERY